MDYLKSDRGVGFLPPLKGWAFASYRCDGTPRSPGDRGAAAVGSLPGQRPVPTKAVIAALADRGVVTDTDTGGQLDLVTFGETMLRLSPPEGERIETARELDFRTAGAESNVAVAAARLGAEAAWLSKLPDSPLGRRVLVDIRSHGVRPAVAWADPGATRQGTYYLEFGGAPRGTDVVYDRADAAVTTATPGEFDLGLLRAAGTVFTSGITPALSATLRETTASLLETATTAGTTTALDVNYRSKLWTPAEARSTLADLFDHVDTLFCAERDAREVLDRSGDPVPLAAGLREAHGFETVVLTRGGEGAVAAAAAGVHERPAVETETLDPVGSGDDRFAFSGNLVEIDVPPAVQLDIRSR